MSLVWRLLTLSSLLTFVPVLTAQAQTAQEVQQAKTPRYRIVEISNGPGKWAKANGLAKSGIVAGQRQSYFYRLNPNYVPFNRNFSLSYFDRDNGFINRFFCDGFDPLPAQNYFQQMSDYFGRIGGKWLPPEPIGEAFVAWNGKPRSLPSLVRPQDMVSEVAYSKSEDLPGIHLGQAYSANRNGWVVGQGAFSGYHFEQHAMLWNIQGRPKVWDLGATVQHSRESVAFDINQDGTIVGEVAVDRGIKEAYVWTVTSTSAAPRIEGRSLGTLGGAQSRAYAVNESNQIVGWAENARFEVRACLWSDSTVEPLAVPFQSKATYAVDLNDLGHAVGYATMDDGTVHPLLWRNRRQVAILPCPGAYGAVKAINNRAQMVGVVGVHGPEQTHATLWEKGRAIDLNSLLPVGSDWRLAAATGVCDSGEIVGWGWRKGKLSVFRLIPESPNRL